MEDSVFTKIIQGEIPAQKIFEDDTIIAFLDIKPIVAGHVLVVPKQQVSHFDELDDQTYSALFTVVKKVAAKVKTELGAARACVRIEGFDVPHTHVHVYPCNNPSDFYGDQNRMQKEPDNTSLAIMAERLRLN